MHRLLTTFLACSFATAVLAADAPILVQVTIPDGARLIAHHRANIIGGLWYDPALAALTDRLRSMPVLGNDPGVSGFALWEALTNAQITLHGLAGDATRDDVVAWKRQPEYRIQAGLGAMAEPLADAWQQTMKPKAIVGNPAGAPVLDQPFTLVRHGDVVVMAGHQRHLAPVAIAPGKHDMTVLFSGHLLGDTITRLMPEGRQQKAQPVLQALHRLLVPVISHMDVKENHIASRLEAKTSLPFLIPADFSLCGRLPVTAYAVSVSGLDGRILWDDLIEPLGNAIAANVGTTLVEQVATIDQSLAAIGITASLRDLIREQRGTWMFAESPGAPLPGYTFAFPRAGGLDQVVAALLATSGTAMPDEGATVPVALPNVPLPLHLVRDRTHWVVTSDALLAADWSTAVDGAWFKTPLGTLAREKAGTDALFVHVSDSAAELRAMQGYLSMMLGSFPLEAKEKQAVMRGMGMVIAKAGLGYEVMHQHGDTLVAEGESLLGGGSTGVIAATAIIAAIAIPNLMESRITANEAAAAASLKSGVFPAQVQFQGGGYRDLDQDNVGEYGFFHELAGGKIAGNANDIHVMLLAPGDAWNTPLPERNGYRFAMYLADGAGGAIGVNDEAPKKTPDHANDAERYFVAYAWPIDENQGRKAFAITHAGTVYTIPAGQLGGAQPAWNAVFGGDGKGWQDQPVWPQQQRRDGGPRPQPQQKPAAPEDAPEF